MSLRAALFVSLWAVGCGQAADVFRFDATKAECAPSTNLVVRVPEASNQLPAATGISENGNTTCEVSGTSVRGITTRGTPSGSVTGVRSNAVQFNFSRPQQFTIAWEGTLNNCFVPGGFSQLVYVGPAVPNEGRASLYLADGCFPRVSVGAGPSVSSSTAGINEPLPTGKPIRVEGSYLNGELRLFVTVDGETRLRALNRTALQPAQIFARPATDMFVSLNAYANGLTGCNCTTSAAWMSDDAVLYGVPVVSTVVNGATFSTNSSAPGSAIGRNSWVTIRGNSLAARTMDWSGIYTPGGRMPTDLAGSRVRINGNEIPLSYVSSGQINAYIPADAPLGTSTLQVSTVSGWSQIPVTIQDLGTALFTYPGADGRLHVAAQNTDYSTVGKDIAGTRPAEAGSVVLLYGTGCGAAVASSTMSGVSDLTNTVRVEIGGQSADIQFAGYTAPGLCQVNVRVPETLPAGTHSLRLQVGTTSSQEVVIAVIGR